MNAYKYIPLLTLVAATSFAGEPIKESADLKADGRLIVSNVGGLVEITGWNRNRVEVTGELGDDSELIFDKSGNSVRVEVESTKRKRRWGDSDDTELYIRVPRNARVTATTVSAELSVNDVEGVLRLQTVSGNLEATVAGQDAQIKTVSGEIDVTGDGRGTTIELKSVSGDIDGTGLAGEIVAGSVSGDVELEAEDFSRLKLNSVSGDLELSGNLVTGGRISAESVSGEIVLRLQSLYNTEYFLESFSGSITPILGYKPQRRSRYAPGERLEIIEGDGASRVSVETMSGDIDIEQTGRDRGKADVQQMTRRGTGRSEPPADFYSDMAALEVSNQDDQ